MKSWLEYLNEAKAEPTGLALMCHSAETADQAKRQLYSARAKAREGGDNSFDSLSISMSPHSDEILYIYESEDKDAQSTGSQAESCDDTPI
jgi:hypothetical protein